MSKIGSNNSIIKQLPPPRPKTFSATKATKWKDLKPLGVDEQIKVMDTLKAREKRGIALANKLSLPKGPPTLITNLLTDKEDIKIEGLLDSKSEETIKRMILNGEIKLPDPE